MYLAWCNFWWWIKGSSVSTSARNFVGSPQTMQPSCPGLSLVTRAEFTGMTLRRSNNSPNGKVKTHWDRKGQVRQRATSRARACSSFSLTSRCLFTMHCLKFNFSPANFWPKTTWLSSPTHPNRLTWPFAIFLFLRLKMKLESRHFDTMRWLKQNRRTHGRGLLQGWWWPVGLKLDFARRLHQSRQLWISPHT
jgi:hypothetical protein